MANTENKTDNEKTYTQFDFEITESGDDSDIIAKETFYPNADGEGEGERSN